MGAPEAVQLLMGSTFEPLPPVEAETGIAAGAVASLHGAVSLWAVRQAPRHAPG